MFPAILAFNLNPDTCQINVLGSGLINHTWKITSAAHEYVLQRINTNVFKQPGAIENNLTKLDNYLKATAPTYLFAAPLAANDGSHLIRVDGEYYRLSPFIHDSHTVDFVSKPAQAYEAAKQFGKFTRLLDGFDPNQLQYSLPDFHNLSLRISQFRSAIDAASEERKEKAFFEIRQIESSSDIADIYEKIINTGRIPLRVIHHDTKINNILFDGNDKGICVIDLDTVMPGYFISDVGDMMRTYLSEANEEEKDISQIKIRTGLFKAIYAGYMEEMGNVLSEQEKDIFLYSGKFMIYMQAVRFLTDYLNGDIYYHIKYADHNLFRAKNQLTLFNQYLDSEGKFNEIIAQFEQKSKNSF